MNFTRIPLICACLSKAVSMLKIFKARTKDHYEQMRELVVQYAAALGFNLEFQDFDREMSDLPGAYASPGGCMLLAKMNEKFVGCVALRDLGDGTCEMKRLFVMPKYRGIKVGGRLAEAVIDRARQLGYKRMRLDTVASMEAANRLYASLGFYQIDAYCHNPLEQAMYYELEL